MTSNELVPHPDDRSPLTDKVVTKIAKHASEGGHWYNQKAEQVLEVPKASGGGMTKCTLRHARLMDLAPGVTTIIGEAGKPQLVRWLRRQSILSALTLPRLISETEQEWLDRVEEDMDETARKAAETGTAIHAALQEHMQHPGWWSRSVKDGPHAKTVEVIAKKLADISSSWMSEVCVVSPAGYGTKIDLINNDYLIDWKSKDGDQSALDEMDLYDEHHMQLAAGLQAIVEGRVSEEHLGLECVSSNPNRRGLIGFISRTHPGCVSFHESKQLVRGWEMFSKLLEFWQAKTGHRPFAKGFRS